MENQPPDLDWRDGTVPVSRRFDDPYYSLQDGPAETRHVFLGGNDLPARFRPGFHIGELGFGTGLNLLVTWAAWRTAGLPGRLHFTSFEAYPLPAADMARAHRAFPALAPLSHRLTTALAAGRTDIAPDLTLTVIPGDARQTLPLWDGRVDAWFLDGFAPSKNPELWEPDLLAQIYTHTAPGGTAATYTAAGHVRRALAAAGFEVARTPGHGRKRHMTRARKPA